MRENEREREKYVYIYIYICCKVENWSKILDFYKLKTGPSYKLKLVQVVFAVFPQFYSVFWLF